MKRYGDARSEPKFVRKSPIWLDCRIEETAMDFLKDAIQNPIENFNPKLAGNISKSELIPDKANWFYENILKPPSERLFYMDWENYYNTFILKMSGEPTFELNNFWVNYQKQYEFNPIHDHSGIFSFVVFMKIPTNWKDQHELPICAHSNSPHASNFQFLSSNLGTTTIETAGFRLSPKDEGRMLFFPATLQHMVYPFYGTEEERITISGNIYFVRIMLF